MHNSHKENRKFFIMCASMVVEDASGRLLLVREGKEPVVGKYNLPGGHVELGESLLGCAIRELAEETGLSVVPDGLIGIYEQSAGINVVFHAHLDGEGHALVPAEDIMACEWMSRAEVAALSDNLVLRHKKLHAILADLQEGRLHDLGLLKRIPLETWEDCV